MVRFYDVCTTDENNLVCTKIQEFNIHSTVHTYDSFVADGICKYPDSFNLYVEWGTATTVISYEQISSKLKEYLREYRSPHGGVAMGISNTALKGEESYKFKYNLLKNINKEIREGLFRGIQLRPDVGFDEFANKFGGLTKDEMLKKKQ